MERSIENKKEIWLIIFIFCSVLACYAMTLSYPFIWDDEVSIVNNPGFPGEGYVRDIFTKDFFIAGGYEQAMEASSAYYRPLVGVSYMLDALVWGIDVRGFRLTNILLHGACSVLFFVFLRRLSFRQPVSFVLALIYALHPAHIGSVVYISGRTDVLRTFFMLLSILAYWDGQKFPSYVFFICGMFTKEDGVVLPAIILCSDVFLKKKFSWNPAVMGMISLLFIVFRRFFLGFSDFHGLASSVNYLGTIASSSFAYLRIGLFPYDLHFERFVPVFHDLFPAFAYLILFFLCIGLFLKKSYRNGRLMFAFSGLFVLFVPVSNIMPFYGKLYVFMADHFLYLPLMFLLIMAACFYEDNSRKIRNFVSAGAAALFIFNIYFFFHYAPLWSDKESFYKQIAGRSAFPLRAYNNLAELYLQKGDPRCLQYLEKVRQIMPDRYVFYYLTKTKWHYFQEKDLDKTISTFHEAIRDGIRNPVIYFAMGDAYEEKGDLARAALSYESAYNLGDRNPYRLIKLSMFYKAIGTEMALEKADFFSREAALIWSQKEGSMNE